MNSNEIVAIISLVLCLVLAVRGLRRRHMDFQRTAAMAVIWALIIAALAFVLRRNAP